jgi:hypothetical protein
MLKYGVISHIIVGEIGTANGGGFLFSSPPCRRRSGFGSRRHGGIKKQPARGEQVS